MNKRPRKKFDVYEERLIRTFNKIHRKVTPTQVADKAGMHPVTAKKKIQKLSKDGFIDCKKEGSRLYCKRTRKATPKDLFE